MGATEDVFQLVGKHTAIPQRALGDVSLRRFHIRLFPEGFHLRGLVGGFRNDIAVFFRGVGRLDAHEHQIGFPLIRLRRQPLQGFKVILIHIGVHGTHHHGFLRGYSHHIHKVSRRQGDCRKGIPTAGLHGDANVVPQLVPDGGNLGLCRGNGHGGVCVHRLNLPVHPLHHGLIVPGFGFEKLDKLLGADVVGKRPQPLSGAAG